MSSMSGGGGGGGSVSRFYSAGVTFEMAGADRVEAGLSDQDFIPRRGRGRERERIGLRESHRSISPNDIAP